MNHSNRRRRPAVAAASLLLSALPVLALGVVAGCDKAGANNGKPAAGGGGGAGASAVGIVDYDRVFQEMGWLNKINQDVDAAGQNFKIRIEAFDRELKDAVDEKRRQAASAARLNPQQLADLNAGRLDKVPLSPEQRNEFVNAVGNANNAAQQARQYATQVLQQRRAQLINLHREALKAPVRRVAEANSMNLMITPVDSVVFYAASIDLTNKVVDDLRQAAPPITIPEQPALTLPKVSLNAPTTSPVGPGAPGAATQPGR